MNKVTLRPQKVSDAKRFYEILNNPHFIYFEVRPSSINFEKEWLKKNKQKIKDNFEYNYAILYNNKLVGACGLKIDQHRKYIGEIGYFLDEAYWGRGITTKAVKILEKIGFEKLKLARIEILMRPENKASERVALKCKYKKEGLMKKLIHHNNKAHDCYLYAKTK